MISTVTIIGAGRVGSALAMALSSAGYRVEMIISRSESSARSLAGMVGSEWGTDAGAAIESDLAVVAVSDNALRDVASALRPAHDTIVVHTAGSYPVEIIRTSGRKGFGVFYPLQTFTLGRKIDFRSVPLLIEASDSATGEALKKVAGQLSDMVYSAPFEERRMLHLAAVFACNFVNRMYSAGAEIAAETALPFTVLEPLMRETLEKAVAIGPKAAQTGPAARGDIGTIERHRGLLEGKPELTGLYNYITESIINSGRI